MNKICAKCNKEKCETEFYNKSPTRKNSFCKQCFNAYCINRWKERKLKAIEYKGGKCVICGYNRCPDALEFHHRVKEEKEFDWNKLRLFSDKKIKSELDKCDLLCSICHREIHYEMKLQMNTSP